MASSTHKQQQNLPHLYGGATAAPPPTPSAQPSHHLVTPATTTDVLSNLLHRLPPTLSLPTRRSPSTTSLPTISFPDPNLDELLLSSASKLGYFQLKNHGVSSQLANSAEAESLSLFELSRDQKESCFPKNWPLGFDDDDEEDGDGKGGSFCMDSSCSTESTDLPLSSLREFTRALEKLGLKMIDRLATAVGFENPIGEDPTRFCSLMWISEGWHGDNKPSGGFYPYVIGLQYQMRSHKQSLLAESGWVSVTPQVGSIMVTLGDIAQVWSNGKVRKVRGRPVACYGDGDGGCISMSMLLTLPMDSRVSPLLPKVVTTIDEDEDEDENENENGVCKGKQKKEEKALFSSFPFEDYAWRVYHESLLFKDPLDRYRV